MVDALEFISALGIVWLRQCIGGGQEVRDVIPPVQHSHRSACLAVGVSLGAAAAAVDSLRAGVSAAAADGRLVLPPTVSVGG